MKTATPRIATLVAGLLLGTLVVGSASELALGPNPVAASVPPGISVLAGEPDVAGSANGSWSTARFDRPIEIAKSPDDDYVYVLEDTATGDNRVRRVSTDDGTTSLVDEGGDLNTIDVDYPGLRADSNGDVWVATDLATDEEGIVKLDGSTQTTMLTDIGGGAPDTSNVGGPFVIDEAGGYLYYISDDAPVAEPEDKDIPYIWRIGLGSLPASADSGVALAPFPGASIIARDMEVAATGGLYLTLVEGSATAQKGLYRVDSGSLTRITENGSGVNQIPLAQQRSIAYSAASSSAYSIGDEADGVSIYRRSAFGEGPQAQVATALIEGVGSNKPLAGVGGLAVSSDGTRAWFADRSGETIRQVGLPVDPNGVSPEELCGSCNPGELRLEAPKVADPVDVATGSLTESYTDIVLPGRGIPVSASRTYNSLLADRIGIFGPGWSSPLDIRVDTSEPGTLKVWQENGALLPFTRATDDSIEAPPRVTSTLEALGGGGWELVRNRNETITFNSAGRVTGWEDRNGNVTSVSYPETDEIVMTSSGERTLTFELDDDLEEGGLVVSVTDDSSPARTVSYSYSSGRLVGVESFFVNSGDTEPVSWGYAYNATSGLLEEVTDPRGNSNFTHYDALGRVDYQLDYDGKRTDIAYGGGARTGWRDVTYPPHDAGGTRATVRYEITELLTTAITTGYGTASARTTRYEYDPEMMSLTRVIGPGDVELATYDYDEHGNVEVATDAAGRETSTVWNDDFNVPDEITDNGGTTTSFTYDDFGNVETVSTPVTDENGDPDGTSLTTFVRGDGDHPEDVTAIVDPDNAGGGTPPATTFSYRDGDGQLEWTEDELGHRTTYGYDTRGFVTSVESPKGDASGTTGDFTTLFTVNDFGMVTEVTNPLDESTTQVYDGNGNVTSVTDPNSQTTSISYDPMNRPLVTTRPDSSTTATTYFPNGATRAQVNGLADETTYTYTPHGEVASMADPLGNTTSYTYDALGRLDTKIDPGGSCPSTGCTDYSYDAGTQELNGIAYSDPATPDVGSFSYDALGRRTSMTQAGRSAQTWAWDNLGRLRSATDINGRTTAYDWSVGGLLTEITYPGQTNPVVYAYDDAGRPESVTDWASRTTSFAFDADGNWTTTTFPSASTNTDIRSYDEAGRLASVEWKRGSTSLGTLSYDRDDDEGLITTETPTGTGFSTRTWGYDTLDQLDQVGTTDLALDDAGNLTRTEDGRLQVFDPAQRLCWSSPTASSGSCESPAADATTYAYDARGNRTGMTYPSGTEAGYGYDQNNQMTSAVVPDVGISTEGQYQTITPARVADTTVPSGTCNGATCARLGASSTTTVQVTGVGAIPAVAAVAAVSGTITVVNPGADGTAELNPNGDAAAATIIYDSGVNESIGFTVPVDANGRITIATSAAADVRIDISGYYTTGSFVPATNYWPTPAAVLADTITPAGTCDGTTCATLAANQTIDIAAADVGEIPADATAAIISVIAVNHTSDGTVRITPNGTASAGTLNLIANEPATGVITAPIDTNGDITLTTTVAVDVMVHVSGWFAPPSEGDEGHALDLLAAPTRIADSTTPTGVCDATTCATLASDDSTTIAIAGQGAVPANAVAAVINLTITDPDATGGAIIGLNTNAAAAAVVLSTGVDTAQTATVPLDPDGTITLASIAASFDFAIDVIGVYTPAVDTWTYTYDATGLRTAKQEQSQTAFQFSWNTAGGLPLLLSQHIGTATTSIVYGPGGTPLYQVNPDGSLLYLHQDHQGSTRLVTTSSGNVHGRITYNAYGETTSDTTPWFLPRPVLGYTGQYVDGETGFVFLRARHLDATTGQFISIDPLEGWTRQPYSYGSGNPVSLSDPSGLWPWDGKCVMGVNCPEDARPVTDLCNTLVYDDCESVAEQHPEATQRVVDVSGGVLDTNPITSWLPLDLKGHGVRTDSSWHQAGRFGMITLSVVLGAGNPAISTFNTGFSAAYAGKVCGMTFDNQFSHDLCAAAAFGLGLQGWGGYFGKAWGSPGLRQFCGAAASYVMGIPEDN